MTPDVDEIIARAQCLDTHHAERLYLAAIQDRPGSFELLLNLAALYIERGESVSAIRWLLDALALQPNSVWAHYNLGRASDDLNEFDVAIREYLIAIRLAPKFADSYYNLALLLRNRGQAVRAVQYWQHYIRLDPTSRWADYVRQQIQAAVRLTELMVVYVALDPPRRPRSEREAIRESLSLVWGGRVA